ARDRLGRGGVFWVSGQEWIEHRLVPAGGVEPTLDAEPLDRLLEAEGTADHADRTEDRRGIAENLVARTRDHVAAGGRDVLDEDQHRQLLFRRELLDAPVDLARLHRRAAGAIDQ